MASHASRYSALDLPRPFRAAAPFVVLAAVCSLSEIDARLPWLVGAFGAVCFAVAGVVRGVRAELELAAVRRTADRIIVHEPSSYDASDLVRWRSEELTSREALDAQRREVERTIAALDPRKLPSASPIQRPAARANEPLLREISARLALSRPVSPRGILLLRSLLRDGGSPLYDDQAAILLPRALRRIRTALEP
jgi:hypothetical protein